MFSSLFINKHHISCLCISCIPPLSLPPPHPLSSSLFSFSMSSAPSKSLASTSFFKALGKVSKAAAAFVPKSYESPFIPQHTYKATLHSWKPVPSESSEAQAIQLVYEAYLTKDNLPANRGDENAKACKISETIWICDKAGAKVNFASRLLVDRLSMLMRVKDGGHEFKFPEVENGPSGFDDKNLYLHHIIFKVVIKRDNLENNKTEILPFSVAAFPSGDFVSKPKKLEKGSIEKRERAKKEIKDKAKAEKEKENKMRDDDEEKEQAASSAGSENEDDSKPKKKKKVVKNDGLPLGCEEPVKSMGKKRIKAVKVKEEPEEEPLIMRSTSLSNFYPLSPFQEPSTYDNEQE